MTSASNRPKPFRPGNKILEFNPVPVMLTQKTHKRFNILIGEDTSQQQLAERILGIPCIFSEAISDVDLLIDNSPKLFRLLSSKAVLLSPQLKESASFWSIDLIEKGSAGANAIVRYAASLLELEKPDKSLVERVADHIALSKVAIEDVGVAIWTAVWLMLGPPLLGNKRWVQPWEDSRLWFSIPGVTQEHRLNSLYLDLTALVLVQQDENDALKKAGLHISPSKVKYLKKLRLDWSRVHDTIILLDLWRTRKYDPYICAFRVANIWESSIT